EPKVEPKVELKQEPKDEPRSEIKQPEEIPGFPKQAGLKIETKHGVPADTDFLKAEPAKKPEGQAGDIAEGAFKFTNVNKPPDVKKDKTKLKREVLIDGFHPKPPPPPEEQAP
ncbi:MAG TPA: hypothetical protein DCL35_02035, partial [Candidatus Omnitrophica bacterium]|nr:hypothetical protein [Candidatus Omnitrophota bacterium]